MPVKNPAAAMTFGDGPQAYVVEFAPLPIDLLVSLLPQLEAQRAAANGGSLAEVAKLMKLITDIAFESVRISDPAMKRERLGQLVNAANYLEVQEKVMAACGLVGTVTGEAQPGSP